MIADGAGRAVLTDGGDNLQPILQPVVQPDLQPVRLGDIWVTPGCADALATAGVTTVDALFAMTAVHRLEKPGLERWRERLRVSVTGAGGTRDCFLKRYADPPPGAWRNLRRYNPESRSLAGVEWNRLLEFNRLGIPCPMPLALGEEFRDSRGLGGHRMVGGHRGVGGHREVRSALLMSAVPGESLERQAGRAKSWTEGEIRRLVTKVADLVSRLHGLGYVHRDLYLSHVFWDAASGRVSLIDLHRVIKPQVWFDRWRLKDLAALNYSTPPALLGDTDRLRWLKQYLSMSKLDATARRWIYLIIGKTRRIGRHDKRRRRRLGR